MDALSSLLVLAALQYGEVADGRPTWAQRELHVYTNLVRVDPEAWADDYACDIGGFSASERQPQAPLRYHDGLAEIAQIHTEDMRSTGVLSHDSSDGTDFFTRVSPYYPGWTVGENVAYGYADNASVVWDGWMCSSGHRANIMSASYTDLGTGVSSTWYTQDFGGGAGGESRRVAMGVHVPEQPGSRVTFLATWDDTAAPAWFAVETGDDCLEMTRFVGTGTRGGWRAEAEARAGCVAYRFSWARADGTEEHLPETGAWQYGSGCEPWVAEAPRGCAPPAEDSGGADTGGTDTGGPGPGADTGDCPQPDRNHDCIADEPLADDEAGGCGCAAGGGRAALLGTLFALAGAVVRRRG